MRSRLVVALAAALAVAAFSGSASAGRRAAPAPGVTRAAILEAEAARAATADQLRLLTTAAAAGPEAMRVLAIRALGRLERPDLASAIAPLLDAAQASVRAEAADALAQSVLADQASRQVARAALMRRLVGESDPGARGAIAEALGRLPIDSPQDAIGTENAIYDVISHTQVVHRWGRSAAGPRIIGLTLSPTRMVIVPGPALVGGLRGLEAFARARAREHQGLTPDTVERLTALAVGDSQVTPQVRRLALLCLLPVDAVGSETAARAFQDDDFQVRRLAITSPQADLDTILAGMKDPAWMVRYEALRRYGLRFQASEGCGPIVGAIGARVDHQSLLAIDLLGAPCRPGDHAVETLLDLAAGIGEGDWRRPAHAMVALAKAAPARGRPMLERFLSAGDWHARMYAARAAGELGDAAALRRLAADANDNVREAAISALSAVEGHAADAIDVEALGASDVQLVMTAAKALRGTADRAAAVPALLASLARLTALDSDTSRDPRLALLERLQELGSPADADRLRPCLADADAKVADAAAKILTAWTGAVVLATPKPRPLQPFVLTDAEFDRLSHSLVRVTMAGGRRFEMRLLMDLAPISAARFAGLVAAGDYNGLTFHRVIPDFLVQGGSPGANEYSGGTRYWRDEPGLTSQTRGTVGSSTRGRDTGDGQFYVNLVDTPRLDHEYTIFGEVTSGMDVVDGILEGDVMRSVELVAAGKK